MFTVEAGGDAERNLVEESSQPMAGDKAEEPMEGGA